MAEQLTLENIQKATEKTIEYFEKGKVDSSDITKIRLSLESILLNYRDTLGETAEFTMKFGRIFGRRLVRIFIPGVVLNPFQSEDEEGAFILQSIQSRMGQGIRWDYWGRKNCLTISVEKKKRPFWGTPIRRLNHPCLFLVFLCER